MEVNIYIGLDLEDEVHSIWVIWTSGLHSWRRTVCMKDNTNLEGQARRPLNPIDLDLRSAFCGSQI